MKIFNGLINKSTSVFIVYAVLLIIGAIASVSLPVSYYPDFTVPAVFINTAYPGADPVSVEESITKIIEDALSSVSGIEQMTSTSQESFSLVQVNFDFGVNVDEKTDEIRKQLDLIRNNLPANASIPEIITINDFVSAPVTLAVYSDRRTEGELRVIAEKEIAPSLSKIPGTGLITVSGGLNTIVKVEPHRDLLIETGLTLNQISAAINFSNTDFPAGEVRGDDRSFTLRVEGKFKTIEDIGNVIITHTAGGAVFLKDIADISVMEETQTKFSRLNENPVITLSVRKPDGGNTIEIANNIKDWLSKNRTAFSPDIKIEIVKDESVVIDSAIANVINSLLLGALLASIVIYLILGSFKNTLIIIISIPVSIVISFIFMKIFNLSINTVSLGGLGMAIGMVVDSAVVVMENSYRYLEENPGKNRLELIAGAVSEVALPISASVLTTVVVFLPMAFTSGLAKVLLGELSLVIVFALTTSIFVSVTLIPVLNSLLLTTEVKPLFISVLFNKILDGIRKIYIHLLNKSLKHRFISIAVFTILMIGGCSLAAEIESGMLPDSDQGEFQITLSYPRGVSVNYTNNKVMNIEKDLLNIDSIKKISSVIGEDILFGTQKPYTAAINVFTDISRPTADVIAGVRNYFRTIPGMESEIRIIDASAGISGSDIEYDITGTNIDVLGELGEQFTDMLSQINGLINIKSGLSKGVPSYSFIPDKKTISSMGFSVFDISQLIRNTKVPQIVTTYSYNGYDIDLILALKGAENMTVRELENTPVVTRNGIVPLKLFGRFTEGTAPAEIKRIDGVRAVNITADVDKKYSRQLIEKEITASLEKFSLPEKYSINKKGVSRAIAESFKTLGIALMIGVMLVFAVMGIQFNSIKLPFVIILSIPFSMPGAFFALYITNQQLNLPSFLGIIMLAGIIVNNGIILIDFIAGNPGSSIRESIIQSVIKRFRPVMMTTLTTITGMFFLALNIGGGGEALKPLAIAVIGGLIYSISVSLILIPVLYSIFSRERV